VNDDLSAAAASASAAAAAATASTASAAASSSASRADAAASALRCFAAAFFWPLDLPAGAGVLAVHVAVRWTECPAPPATAPPPLPPPAAAFAQAPDVPTAAREVGAAAAATAAVVPVEAVVPEACADGVRTGTVCQLDAAPRPLLTTPTPPHASGWRTCRR